MQLTLQFDVVQKPWSIEARSVGGFEGIANSGHSVI